MTTRQAPDQDQQPRSPEGVPCTFSIDRNHSCTSSNNLVRIYAVWHSDTTGCNYHIEIDWGDGGPIQTVELAGGPIGEQLMASHAYSSPGYYSLSTLPRASTGCSGVRAAYDFTLTS